MGLGQVIMCYHPTMRPYVVAVLLLTIAGSALAAQPTNPGCFGTDRAEWLHANGGAAWGEIAPVRGADNGQINRDYKLACGGAPTSD